MKNSNFFRNWIGLALFLISLLASRAQTLGPNGHFYKVVLEPGITWEQARLNAAESSFNAVQGYLATITSPEEDQFIEQLRLQAAPPGEASLWVGGYQDADTILPGEGWTWINGEGGFPGQNGLQVYANWQPQEPNDYWGIQSERFLSVGHFNLYGWNDEPEASHASGYVIEYPGGGSDAILRIVAVDPSATENSLEQPSQTDTAAFEISRQGSLALDLPVFYSIHGTAGNGHDYEEISRSIIIPAGQNAVKLTIVPRADLLTVVEPMETVGIRLEPSPILNPLASYRIDSNAREAATVIYEMKPPGNGALEIAMPGKGMTYESGEPVVILAALYYSNLVAAVDFYAGNLKIGSITPETRQGGLQFHKLTWTNPPLGTHVLTARATKSEGSQLVSSQVEIIVKGDFAPPIVAIRFIAPVTTEPPPNADYAPGHLEISRIGSTANDLQVFYTVSGTATAGSDYEPLQGYVVIGAGRTAARIVIAAKDDFIYEPTETVIVTLTHPEVTAFSASIQPNYQIHPELRSATVHIFDNDAPPTPPVVSISANPNAISETNVVGLLNFSKITITRTGPTENPMRVFLKYEGTATPIQDYKPAPPEITIPANASTYQFDIHAFYDGLAEGFESAIIHLVTPPVLINPAPADHPYTIDPNHAAATIMISDAGPSIPVVRVDAMDRSATEFPPFVDGIDPASFKITRFGDLTQTLQVFFSLHGTAINGEDYQRVPDSVIFPSGQSSVTVTILPIPNNDAFYHHYEFINDPGITWENARAKAAQATYLGTAGHLATITSPREDAHIEQLRQEAGSGVFWVGGFQEPGELSITEGWKWVNNEGPIPGNNSSAGYANWLQGEPNDYWGPASENHMVIGWLNSFGWNDQGANVGAQGYVMEFDIPTPAMPINDEKMETVGIRLEYPPFPTFAPSYVIHSKYSQTAAVIFEQQAPAGGAIEIAIPSAGEIYPEVSEIEFLAAAYHPTNDITRAKWLIDGTLVGNSEGAPEDNQPGGVMLHWFRWTSVAPGEHVVEAFADVNDANAPLHSSRIPFTVEGEQENHPPIARVTHPTDGAVFIEGDPIEVRAEGSDPDGTLTSLELLLDGSAVASTNRSPLRVVLNDLAVGPHTLHARATDDQNAKGISEPVRILVRHRDAVSFVHRELPETYTPGVPFRVELRAVPPNGTHAYAVEDQPPAGWLVTEISHGGAFDPINRKVKFGPFTDAQTRILTYRLSPPANATGRHEFTGESSINGALYPISGDQYIELIQQHHPADTNTNFAIVLSEVTAYAAAWKAGDPWPTGPVPIPLSYVTRAGYIWKRGEGYRFDPSQGPAPACWVPLADNPRLAALSASGAERSIVGTEVRIGVTPPSGAASFALEEKPPRGWTVSNISHEGRFDAVSGIIRWGVFFDATPRTLTYTVTPAASVNAVGSFTGQFSYDGRLAEISSANSITINGDAPIQITECHRLASGTQLRISGPTGQTAVIEGSADLQTWIELKSIFVPNAGVVEFTDETAPASGRFYRLRAQ